MKGSLWHIKYPIEGSDEFVVVATTRPETMLGDTAVAVHPQNERLRHLIGKTAILPLVGRRIPIVADEYADPEKGTGAVKITPAHDFNDFEVGRRHDLPLVNVLDVEGRLDLTDNAAFLDGVPASAALDETLALHGLDRFAARKKIVERLEALGLLDKIEPNTHSGAARRPFRRGDRALSHRPVVRRRQDAGAAGDRRGARRAHRLRAGALGRRPSSTGWSTSSPGASRARSGGAIAFRPGTGRTAKSSSPRAKTMRSPTRWRTTPKSRRSRPRRGTTSRRSSAAGMVCRRVPAPRRRRARHLVLLGAVAVLDARLARRDAGAATLLPDQRAGHRLRHHLLLGRAHDDDGAALHERRAVPRPSSSTPWCATSSGAEDVEVEGQRHRSAGA